MNQSFYESRVSEKLNDLRKEGMMSQAHYRSRAPKRRLLSGLPSLILVILGILGLVQLFLR